MEARFWLFTLTPLLALMSYAVLSVLVLRRFARSRVHRFFALYLLVMAIWSLGSAMMRLDPDHILFWNRVLVAGAMIMPFAYFGFVHTFLDEKQDHWLWVGVVCVLGLEIANVMGLMVVDAHLDEGGLIAFEPGPATYLASVYGVFFWIFAGWYLIRAHRRTSSPVLRNRIRYPLIGLLFVALGTATNYLPALGALPVDHAANLVNAFVLAYAILRFHLLDVEIVVRKGLIYSIPTAIIGAGYFLIVFLAVNLLELVTGYQVLLLAVILAAITAVAFQPLRDRAQSWVDRLFFREQYDAGLMLQRLSRTAASVLDLNRLTRMILDEIVETMHVERAALLLKHEVSGEFRVAAQHGPSSSSTIRFRTDHPVVDWLSTHGTVLTQQRLSIMPQFRALWTQEREDLERFGAELFVPLSVRGSLIGVLVMGSKLSETSYSHDEELTLTTLANQTAVAIENARLFSLEQRKAEESAALLEIARAISSTLDLDRLLKIVARRTAEVCGSARCSIFLLDESGDRLLPLMSQFGHGARDAELWQAFKGRTHTEPIDEIPLIRRLFEEREPAVIDGESAKLLPARWIKPFGIQSLLAVPLISKEKALGLMVLDHTEPGRRFTDEQVNLATTIGSQVTIAIENTRLYEQTIEEKERTETIVEQAFAGIMVVDPSARILSLNPEVQAITGYPPEELLGRRLLEVFGPGLSAEGSPLSKVMVTGERVPPTEATLVGKQGARDVLLGVTSIREGYLLNFADITRLKEVDRLKSAFVANVSHELRAPLASIKAYAELLLDNLEGEDERLRRRFLSIIDQEADWLADLINDLLDLSRLESEQYAVQLSYLSLNEIIDGVVALLENQIQRYEVKVNVQVPDDLPLLLADKELLTILARNLIGNAVKFSRDGGQVDLVARQNDDSLVLEIADQGIGIPPEDLPYLFTKFYRSSMAKESGIRGTGLGLALVKQAVELHHGAVEVESELGVGTRFSVTLPIKPRQGTDGRVKGRG